MLLGLLVFVVILAVVTTARELIPLGLTRTHMGI